jgi:hypothetical protein
VCLVFLSGWVRVEVSLHPFLTNFELKLDEIFDGSFKVEYLLVCNSSRCYLVSLKVMHMNFL